MQKNLPQNDRIRRLKVAVIGGGIGGLAAAVALRQRGMDVQVFERSAHMKEVGAGLRLTPNALKALRALGLEDEAVAIGVRIERGETLSWRSGGLISVQDTSAARFGATVLTIHRADLLDIFQRHVPNALVRLDARCTGVKQSANAAVAQFADGNEVEADVIVGADGIHSVVRASLFGADKPRFTGCICWRGLVPVERVPYVPNNSQRWLGPHGHVVTYPVRRGELINFVAHYDSESWTDESWTQSADRAELAHTYRRWNDSLLKLFAASEQNYKWALYDRDPLDRWGDGRLTLMGDAAHAMLPYLAQGAGMTIEDACVLAQHLDGMRDDPGQALRAYERARIPRTRRAQLDSRARAKENHLVSPLARLRRNLMAGLAPKLNPSKAADPLAWIFDYDVASLGDANSGDTLPIAAA